VSTVAEATARSAARARARRRSPVRRLTRRAPFLLLILLILVYVAFPFYWALRSAFTADSQLFNTPVQYFPTHPVLTNFREVLSSDFFKRALLNSTIVAASVTLIALALGSLAGYALGRFRFRGRSAALYLMLSMTIFPQIAILGALYTLINGYHVHALGLSFRLPHLYNTLGALIFSDMVLVMPLTVWILTTFMRALPRDLEEAAYVDGATPLQVFYKVMLPLIAPGLVTAGLLAFITAWQEFLYALSFTETQDHFTVTVAITQFVGKSGSTFQTPWGQIMAATVIVTAPLIALTLALQRRILAGLTAGAVKG
jgi:trehalose/maltose transport system permease protein